MTIQITWARSDDGLASLLGITDWVQDLKSLSDKVQTLTAALSATEEALSIVEGILSRAFDLALGGFIRPIIEDLRDRIRDLRKTGVYMLPVGFHAGANATVGSVQITRPDTVRDLGVRGGLQGLKNHLRTAFLNERDPRWPGLSHNAFVCGTGVFAFGLDMSAIDTVADLIEKGFMSDPMLRSCQDLEKYAVGLTADGLTSTFKDAFDSYRSAQSAKFFQKSRWSSLTLEELLPTEFSDFLIKLEATLNGILALTFKVNLFQKYIAVIKATIVRIQEMLALVQSVIAFLDLLLVRFPVAIFQFDGVGGMPGMADALDDWFDPQKHPELSDVPPGSMMIGLLLMAGSTSAAELDENRAIINRVVKFGIGDETIAEF